MLSLKKFTLILFLCISSVHLEVLPTNSLRHGRSYMESNEDTNFVDERYVPRFYLNRPKNRYSYFTSEFFNDNKSVSHVNRFDEDRNFPIEPLLWQDFPKLVDNKLAADPSADKVQAEISSKLPSDKIDASIMSNYSQIVPKFPIYFTNPSTGVVYAISEVTEPGKVRLKNDTHLLNEGSDKAYDDGKYTLQCTMAETSLKPLKKKTISPTAMTARPTSKKSKRKKLNNSKKRTQPTRTIIKYEDPVLVQTVDKVLDEVYDKFENAMTEKVVKKVRPKNSTRTKPAPIKSTFSSGKKPLRTRRIKSTTATPFSGSKRRKLTKRMAPVTVPVIVSSTKPTIPNVDRKTLTKPLSSHHADDYYLDFDDFAYGDAAADYSFGQSEENYESTKKKKAQKLKKSAKKTTNKDSSSSSEEQPALLDYVSDVIAPIHEAFSSLTEKAATFIAPPVQHEKPPSEESSMHNGKVPQHLLMGSETESELGNSSFKDNPSWFGSWFGSKVTEPTATSTTEEPDWFDYWYDEDETTTTEAPSQDSENGSRWFFNWFDNARSTTRQTTTTTTTTTPAPPSFLTIIDPVKNAPNWFGMLAQHLVNSTSNQKSTALPNFEEDIPRKISYNRHQIWRLNLRDQRAVIAMEDYKNSAEGAKLQWLKGPSLRGPTDVLIPPKLITDFQGTLNFEDIAHDVLIFDLGKAITYESKSVQKINRNKAGHPLTWTRYHQYNDIIGFLEFFQVRFPSLVELIHLGRSYEGRPLVVVKISKNPKSSFDTKSEKYRKQKIKERKAVFIEAGVHGREWIGPATATWIIREIVKIMRTNQTSARNEFIKETTWYIVPVLNPDGYEYTHEYDRLWRKSRSKNISKPSGIFNSAMAWLQKDQTEKLCYGVDLNRNWNHKWGQKGSSKSPCNEFFAGPTAFSEPEARDVSKFLLENGKHIELFISLQAYGQIISYPSHVNTSYGSQKIDDLMDAALVGTDGLRNSGSRSRYRINTSHDMISTRSGTSDNFAMYEAAIPFSYTIDLSDDGVHGYLLPASFIEPTAKDAFQIIKSIVDYI